MTTFNSVKFAALLGSAGVLCSIPAAAAEHMSKNVYQTERAFSPAVVTEGGKTIWLAGSSALKDANGKDIAWDFDAQLKRVWEQIDEVLRRQGGTLNDIVTITVFITDSRLGDKVVESRRQIWKDGNYPGSALITVANLAKPGLLVEIQAIAVVGDKRPEAAK